MLGEQNNCKAVRNFSAMTPMRVSLNVSPGSPPRRVSGVRRQRRGKFLRKNSAEMPLQWTHLLPLVLRGRARPGAVTLYSCYLRGDSSGSLATFAAMPRASLRVSRLVRR